MNTNMTGFKTLEHRYSYESTLRELSDEYQHDRVSKSLCITVLCMKVASALEGLTLPMLRLLLSKGQGCKDF